MYAYTGNTRMEDKCVRWVELSPVFAFLKYFRLYACGDNVRLTLHKLELSDRFLVFKTKYKQENIVKINYIYTCLFVFN